jgi:ATP-dependent NAD(P)H-hydrate dehydratase
MASQLTRKELLSKVYKMVPPMLEKFHKGKSRGLNSITDR